MEPAYKEWVTIARRGRRLREARSRARKTLAFVRGKAPQPDPAHVEALVTRLGALKGACSWR